MSEGTALQRQRPAAPRVRVAMVVAAARNGVIGRGGALPWRLSDDLKRFKKITMGKPVIMGRKTFESIGRPLPGRANIVVSRRADFAADGIVTAARPDDALTRAEAAAIEAGAEEVCVIGGAEIYAALLPEVDIVRLTVVDAAPEGDAHMPSLACADWRGDIVGMVEAEEKNDCAAVFVDLFRV